MTLYYIIKTFIKRNDSLSPKRRTRFIHGNPRNSSRVKKARFSARMVSSIFHKADRVMSIRVMNKTYIYIYLKSTKIPSRCFISRNDAWMRIPFNGDSFNFIVDALFDAVPSVMASKCTAKKRSARKGVTWKDTVFVYQRG